mmetsp:Transcript_14305/g.21416  ORF Transcript_14305/g.21416 Transcript_14305/m.21416 type:complete len:408 (-) Transcript_14305:251-1474(-)|eukprot:CAMPEP_0185027324 /NCGR_PEP_ID=MMETSP1103-20130426/12229_1 /TAXON_ID=36769 /ORGANISM="Paraphysomonas bandaiensis, Strain Caron Lab Isolate" /LENGTH=407 /DNA_ID=CAMNT_0027561259 /DNA_START=138 /DNA_END=1361 /DNA_ORIENTATION=-
MGNCGSSEKSVQNPGAPSRLPHKSAPVPHVFDKMYELGEELGSGAFSVVKAGTNKATGEKVAVKVINRHTISSEDEAALTQEVNIMKSLDHPNIVKLYDFFREKEKYYLVLEYLEGGELFDRIVAKKTYNEKEARDVVSLVLSGLKYMHDRNIAHRDLKPENLILASKKDDANVKIADFGFASRKNQGGEAMATQCGTPGYVAPEILRGNAYSKAVDMWSMGIITYIILGGYPPFHHSNQVKLFKKIKKGAFEFHPKYWENISVEAKDFISSLLQLDVEKRLTVDQAINHPWFKTDENALAGNDLESTQKELRKNQLKKKFRAAVHTVVAAERMSRALGGLGIKKEPISTSDISKDEEHDDDKDSGGFRDDEGEEVEKVSTEVAVSGGEGEEKRGAETTADQDSNQM